MFSFGYSRPIMTHGSGVTRAPPNHTLLAFLNLHGIINKSPTIISWLVFALTPA